MLLTERVCMYVCVSTSTLVGTEAQSYTIFTNIWKSKDHVYRVPEVLYSRAISVHYIVPKQSLKDVYRIGDRTGLQACLVSPHACRNTIMLKSEMKKSVVARLRGSAAYIVCFTAKFMKGCFQKFICFNTNNKEHFRLLP